MKIEKIEIKNFRSLQDAVMYPKDIFALVGRNKSVKSNVIKALELFFEGTVRLVNSECFYNHETGNHIEILVTFNQISEWERENFKPWLDENKLIVGREIVCKGGDSFEMNNLAITRVPEPEWLQEDAVSGEKIAEWWSSKEELKINGMDFGSELGNTKPTVGKWKETIKIFLDKLKSKK